MARVNRVSLGSVSSGTLKSADLIDSFMWTLRQHDPKRARSIAWKNRRILRRLAEEEEEDLRDSEQCEVSWLLHEELTPALEELAPDYSYFGAHMGAEADFGFWPMIDELTEAMGAEDGVTDYDTLNQFSAEELETAGFGHAVQVSDHGNIELYRLKYYHRGGRAIRYELESVWGVV